MSRIHWLCEGDHLTVYHDNGTVAFQGEIETDRQVGWREYPKNPGRGQPCALGFWVHWTQRGWQPDDWAELFMREPSLRADCQPRQSENPPVPSSEVAPVP
jgi:hypothetical protein